MVRADDVLTTERLTLRRFTWEDLDALDGLQSDPRVMRFVGGVFTRAKTEEMLQDRVLAYYAEHPGLGIWATIERASGAFVGLHLLNHIRGETDIQVGYLLVPRFWGLGYATEMSVQLLSYGFSQLGLRQIVGITELAHTASQRVLLKAGLQRRGERAFAHPAYAASGPLAWFERDAAEWLGERGGSLGAEVPVGEGAVG